MKNSDDAEALRKAADEVGQLLQKIGAAAYSQGGPAAGGPGGPGGPQGGPTGPTGEGGGGNKPGGDDNVVDGEFRSA